MKVTATEFRSNLFQLVDRALRGELVELSHKGRLIRLVPEDPPSKLSRLVKKPILKGAPEEVDEVQKKLSKQLQTGWERKWKSG